MLVDKKLVDIATKRESNPSPLLLHRISWLSLISSSLKMVARTGDPPRGSAAAAGLRRRRMSGAGAGAGSSSGSNMLRFYTDDAPGLKITPTVVLVMSLGFIGFVTTLHVIGKLYHYRAGV